MSRNVSEKLMNEKKYGGAGIHGTHLGGFFFSILGRIITIAAGGTTSSRASISQILTTLF